MNQSVSLRSLVARSTGQNAFRCYQCGNCTAGCPMAGRGDLLPHQVLRCLQLGDDAPLRALQPWLCVGCQTCATRCPQELDLSRVMDALRAEALRRRTAPPSARRVRVFNQIFLKQVLSSGRLSEVWLGAFFNLAARSPLENLAAIPSLLSRGKIRLDGKKVRLPRPPRAAHAGGAEGERP